MADYYGTWKEDSYICDKCGWKGTGEECAQGEMFNDLYEIDCPWCGKRVDVVLYPTIEESRANWDKVREADKAMIEARERFLNEAIARCLESPDELPEVEGEELIFVWDQLRENNRCGDTLITHGKQIIWREPSFYEGYDRFIEVAGILKEKYGSKLVDLIPTERSQNYLLGDCWSAVDLIKRVRDCFGLSEWQNLPTKNSRYGTTIDWHKVIVEKPEIKKIDYTDSKRAQDLSKIPRLNTITQLPEIYSDDDLIFVWDEQEAEPIPQIVIKYGNSIVWKEFSYYQCYDRFEPIAILLQQKYGKKVQDLTPTRRSEANLFGDWRYAELIAGKVKGNLWMSQYALDNGKIASEAVKDNSDNFISNNANLSTENPIPITSEHPKENRAGYNVLFEEEDFWFDCDLEVTSSGGKVIYETSEEALTACKQYIDDFLIENYKRGMTAKELYENYLQFGKEPYIFPSTKNGHFSAWEYAEERCKVICE